MLEILQAVAPQIIGGLIGNEGQEQQASEARAQADTNYLRQLEFAKHGIRWKVEDAIAAGLHPLYAIGGAGAAFAPNPITVGDNSLASMGQNVARAISAQETAEQRTLRLANLAKLEAETEKESAMAFYYRSEAMRAQLGWNGPGMPSSSGSALLGTAGGAGGEQPSSWNLRWPGDVRTTDGIVSLKPAAVTSRAEGDRSVEAGVNPAHSLFNPDKKGLHEIIAPSKELKERFEDLPLAMQLYYGLRNLPVLGQWLVQEGIDAVPSRLNDSPVNRQSVKGRIRPAEKGWPFGKRDRYYGPISEAGF